MYGKNKKFCSEPTKYFLLGWQHFYTKNWHDVAATAVGQTGRNNYKWEASTNYCIFDQNSAGRIPIYTYWDGLKYGALLSSPEF